MDVIVIGAGAAGLMAAKELSLAGLKVCVLEARNRLGGRISSFMVSSSKNYEGGAEFIHGNLPVTLDILKEAGIEKRELEGKMLQFSDGQWSLENNFFTHAEKVIEKLKQVEADINIAAFIDKYFAGKEYETLRVSLTGYVEGYYSGEMSKTSARSFLQEWLSEDEQQYRPVGGYGKLIQYMADVALKAGTVIELETVAKEIRWTRDQVQISDEANKCYTAKKAIVTVPLGVWTAAENVKGAIRYTPGLPEKIMAAGKMGFGAVIKILLSFNKNFYWAEILKAREVDLSTLHMALTDQPISTWWTQFPDDSSLLTGWLSGPKAWQMKDDDAILASSLQSLQNIFQIPATNLKDNLEWFKIFNWTDDPYTLGSYSYSTLDTATARKILMEPCANTLFFAGEALYTGPEMGTVEAALTSGKEVASNIILISGKCGNTRNA